MPLLYGLLVGICMGVLIQRVGASSPTMILRALRLENLTIIKFMATTIAVGTIGVYVLGSFMPMHIDIKPTYVVGVLVGGLIFGVGFALGGYCPGTCVVGIGERRKDAFMALARRYRGRGGFHVGLLANRERADQTDELRKDYAGRSRTCAGRARLDRTRGSAAHGRHPPPDGARSSPPLSRRRRRISVSTRAVRERRPRSRHPDARTPGSRRVPRCPDSRRRVVRFAE